MYFYAMVKCKLGLNEEGERLEPKLPFKIYSFVAIKKGGGFVHDSLNNLELDGLEVIAWIHVVEEDKLAVQAFNGYIGETKEEVINHPDYSTFYPYTVGDLKKQVLEDQTVIEYEGADKNEKALFVSIVDNNNVDTDSRL